LEGNLSSFYADFTDRRKPVAVIEAQFFLLSEGDAGPVILFARSYSSSAPITGNGAASLVSAWNHAFRTLLEKLTADLTASAPAAARTSALRDAQGTAR
jgi:ABC-type uncharacterized transport system auxiliary subunit